MTKYLYIAIILIISVNSSKGQTSRGLYGSKMPGSLSIMVSGIGGPAYLFGDVGGRLEEQIVAPFDWDKDHTSFMYNMGLRYLFPSNFGLKSNIVFGNFTGVDANTSNSSRAYTFEANITEFSVVGEFVIWGGLFSKKSNRNMISLFAGAGVLHSNSTLSREGGLRLSDTFMPSVTTPVIPVGISYQYTFNSNLSIGAEFAWRYTFTDYLDGLSTPDSKNNDMLANISFTVNYKLLGKPNMYDCNCEW